MAADAEEEKATAGMAAKAEQVMSAMMADDMEDFICGECDAEEENNDDDGWDGFGNGCDDKLCFFCQKEPILKNQIFGAVCASDVRGARKDAKSQGKLQLAAFKLMEKKRDEELREAVATFKVKCKSFGRGVKRAPFDWAGFRMGFTARSYTNNGSRIIKMSMGQWCQSWCVDNFKDLKTDKYEAQQARFAHLETVPLKAVFPDKQAIWAVKEEYIDAGNSREQFEELAYGHKNIKNPSAGQLSEIIGGFGKDHQERNSANYGKLLGIEDDVMGMLQSNPFAVPSQTQEEAEAEQLEEIKKASAQIDKKEASAGKNRKEKPFDEAGIRTIMDSVVKEKAGKLHTKALGVWSDVEELLKEIKASVFFPEFKSAVGTLEGRQTMLSRNLTEFKEEEDPIKAAELAWATYVEALVGQSEPWEKVGTVMSWPKTYQRLTTYTLNNMDSIKTEKQRLSHIEKDYDVFLSRVRDQKNRLSSASKKKTSALVKQKQNEEKKNEELAKKRKAEAVQEAAAKRLRPVEAPATYLAFIPVAMADSSVGDIFRTESFATSLKRVAISEPVICSDNFPDSEDVTKQVNGFYDRFKAQPIFTTSKRGAEQHMNMDPKVQDIFSKFCITPSEGVSKVLSESEKQYLKSPWTWAYAPTMEASGPEFTCLQSWKTQWKGTRQVVTARFAPLLEWVMSTAQEGCTVSVKAVVDAFASATLETLPAMIEAGVAPVKGSLAPGETLRLPAGWVLLEKVVNKEEIAGIRWLEVPPRITTDFKELAGLLAKLPCKPGSTMAFMKNIYEGLSADEREGTGKGKGGKGEAENAITNGLGKDGKGSGKNPPQRPAAEGQPAGGSQAAAAPVRSSAAKAAAKAKAGLTRPKSELMG